MQSKLMLPHQRKNDLHAASSAYFSSSASLDAEFQQVAHTSED